MAARKFSLKDVLADSVSDLNTQERIEYIDLDLIDPDPENFYSLDGLDELAGNIELIGLQQPLRVRSVGGRYTIISGHRRRAACLLIRDGGSEQFAGGVPCIVEYGGQDSKAMQELKLIYANSSTRVLSSAEISRQAERVQELLYQLKAEGVEFPGRMRDHVAAACQVSASKIARLHAIRENLVPVLLEKYDAGTISEVVAYRLSQEQPVLQTNLNYKLGPALKGISADTLDAVIAQERKRTGLDEDEERATARVSPTKNDEPSAVDGLKKYLDSKSDDDRAFWSVMDKKADSLILRSFASPATGPRARMNNIDALRIDLRNSGSGDGHIDWDGSNKGFSFRLDWGAKIERTWTEVYDALAAIALARYRQILVDDLDDEDDDEDEDEARATARVAPTETDAPGWRTGTPARDGRYLCQLDLGLNKPTEQKCDFRDGQWTAYGRPVSDIGEVVGWWPLPEGRE